VLFKPAVIAGQSFATRRRIMAPRKTASTSGNLIVNVFEGTRQPISKTIKLLIRLIDGNQRSRFADYRKGPSVAFRGVPVFDNFGDNYTVIVWADGYAQAGSTPVKISLNAWQATDLMLIRKDAGCDFAGAQWEILQQTHPKLIELLSHGAANKTAAKRRYEDLMKSRPPTLAALLNIVTAMAEIDLRSGTPLDYFKELVWGEMEQDRFFAYADLALVEQVELAKKDGVFAPEFGSGLFHPEATRSYKQVRFGEANVQLTFHEKEVRKIDGVPCVRVESDMDYHKDIAAHTLLEVFPNTISGRLTDPRQVYVLRWIAGRRAGVPEFEPPYTIV
jgi:hypothetical protein